MPVRVTLGACVAHWYSFATPRCRTAQYRRTFIPHSASLYNELVDRICLMVCDWGVLRTPSMLLCRPELLTPFFISTVSSFSSFLLSIGIGIFLVFGLVSPPSLPRRMFKTINNNNLYHNLFKELKHCYPVKPCRNIIQHICTGSPMRIQIIIRYNNALRYTKRDLQFCLKQKLKL